jgi:multimeric flavodoxin WrbA
MLEVFGGEADIIRLYDSPVRPCRGCGGCAADPVCALDGDLADFPERLAGADCLLIVSPIHFASLSAPLIAFFSRLQPFWRARRRGRDLLARRPGQSALAASGGSDYPGMFAPARAVAAAVAKTLSIPFAGLAAAAGTDRLPVAENPAALAAAARLATEMLAAVRQKAGGGQEV